MRQPIGLLCAPSYGCLAAGIFHFRPRYSASVPRIVICCADCSTAMKPAWRNIPGSRPAMLSAVRSRRRKIREISQARAFCGGPKSRTCSSPPGRKTRHASRSARRLVLGGQVVQHQAGEDAVERGVVIRQRARQPLVEADRHAGSGCFRARSPATLGSPSRPTTSAPGHACLIMTVSVPVPAPRSSTRWPAAILRLGDESLLKRNLGHHPAQHRIVDRRQPVEPQGRDILRASSHRGAFFPQRASAECSHSNARRIAASRS